MEVEIWTDGSSLDNGKPICVGGWSAVFFMGSKTYIRYGHLKPPSSNNRGEIFGVLYASLLFKEKKNWKLNMTSDSQYVVKTLNEWRHGWSKSALDSKKNTDLFIPLFKSWDSHGNSSIRWVKGHSGVEQNELADVWAGNGMRNIKIDSNNNEFDIQMIDEEEIYARCSRIG